MAEWCVVDVKAAALKFIAVAYFEGAKKKPLLDAAHNAASWDLAMHINRKFRTLLDQSDVEMRFAANQSTPEELEELLNLSLRVISNFFDHCFQLAGSTQQQQHDAGRICGTLIRMYAEDTL